MDTDDLPRRGNRGPMLGLMLTVIGLGFFLLVLILISGGFFLYVVAACAAIAGLCAVHYVLWGRAMEQAVAGEREEELLRQRARDAEKDWDAPFGTSGNGHVRRR